MGMRAMVLTEAGQALRLVELQVPRPAAGQALVKVNACAVCRTDLHVVDGELPKPKLPLVPGHEIVGRIAGPPSYCNDGRRVWVKRNDRNGGQLVPATKSVSMSDPMNHFDDPTHADKAKEASEAKKPLPTRNEAKTPEKAQACNLEKLYGGWRLEQADA